MAYNRTSHTGIGSDLLYLSRSHHTDPARGTRVYISKTLFFLKKTYCIGVYQQYLGTVQNFFLSGTCTKFRNCSTPPSTCNGWMDNGFESYVDGWMGMDMFLVG
eukprot:SAG31_NODE_351_length_17237_cov_7.010445_18_plen_104_part_00